MNIIKPRINQSSYDKTFDRHTNSNTELLLTFENINGRDTGVGIPMQLNF